MDCNQVFMILTRGPFPTGEPWDEEVELHLETCGDCWRLAEALRPALEVFQEAVPPAEGRDLPGYWGDARPASEVIAELTSATARTTDPANGRTVCRVPATGVRRVGRTQPRPDRRPLPHEFSSHLLHGLALAATMTAAAVALVLLLRW